MLSLLRGLSHAPWLVALARGIAEAVVLAILATVIAFLTSNNVPEFLQVWAPLLIIVFRQAEGIVDQIDPAKKRVADVEAAAAGDPDADPYA